MSRWPVAGPSGYWLLASSINCCIHTVVPPDDGPRYARNMQSLTEYTKDNLCIKLVFVYTMILRSCSTLALTRAVCSWCSLPVSSIVIKADWPSTLLFVTKQSVMAVCERRELINFSFYWYELTLKLNDWCLFSFLFHFLVLECNSCVLSNFIFKNCQRSSGNYIYIYIYIYIQGVPGGMDKTSGECSLCWTIPM